MHKKEGKLVFLYDKLMNPYELQRLKIHAKFVCCAVMRGDMFWLVERRRRNKRKIRNFAVYKPRTTRLIYGGIFYIEDWKNMKLRLNGFYHNSSGLVGEDTQQDLYKQEEVDVRPIKFKSYKDLEICKYDIGDWVKCITWTGNTGNGRVGYNANNKRYYKANNIDEINFKKMIKKEK